MPGSQTDQLIHPSARTDPAVRRAIRESRESAASLAQRFGINPKTVRKWRQRTDTADLPMGRKQGACLLWEQATVISFRRHMLLPLDDCLYALQPLIPSLTRSSLHRFLQRYGINRLPDWFDNQNWSGGSELPGRFRLSAAAMKTRDQLGYVLVMTDRVSKLFYSELLPKYNDQTAANFLRAATQAVPYPVHMVITDKVIPPAISADRSEKNIFSETCRELDIEHICNEPDYPWNDDQISEMENLIEMSLSQRTTHLDFETFRDNVAAFTLLCNMHRKLKALGGMAPCQFAARNFSGQLKNPVDPCFMGYSIFSNGSGVNRARMQPGGAPK